MFRETHQFMMTDRGAVGDLADDLPGIPANRRAKSAKRGPKRTTQRTSKIRTQFGFQLRELRAFPLHEGGRCTILHPRLGVDDGERLLDGLSLLGEFDQMHRLLVAHSEQTPDWRVQEGTEIRRRGGVVVNCGRRSCKKCSYNS